MRLTDAKLLLVKALMGDDVPLSALPVAASGIATLSAFHAACRRDHGIDEEARYLW